MNCRSRWFAASWLLGLLATAACDSEQAKAPAASSSGGAAGTSAGGAAGGLLVSGGFPSAGGALSQEPLFPPSEQRCPDPEAPAVADDLGPLAAYVTSRDAVGRTVLYSWTTREQVAELRTDPTLLTRVASANGQRGRATDALATLAGTDELAAVLSGPAFEKKRFGWTNAWATLLGWAGEAYGDQLLEIRLRSEALIVVFDQRSSELTVFDVNNQPVDRQVALAAPERIGAIYFVDTSDFLGCHDTFGPGSVFREYVLCNEGMIEGWSLGTAELREHLVAARDALGSLRDALARSGCRVAEADVACWREAVVGIWGDVPVNPVQAYEASLAFPNDLYMPSANNLERLIQRIDVVLFEPDPLVHENP